MWSVYIMKFEGPPCSFWGVVYWYYTHHTRTNPLIPKYIFGIFWRELRQYEEQVFGMMMSSIGKVKLSCTQFPFTIYGTSASTQCVVYICLESNFSFYIFIIIRSSFSINLDLSVRPFAGFNLLTVNCRNL